MRRIRQFSPIDAEIGARLVGAAGVEEFADALFEAARSIARIDELFSYIVVSDNEPQALISRSVLDGVGDRVKLYVRRFYRHDPAVHAIRKIAPGESFVQRISLTSIIPHDYRMHCFTEPGFSEKLSFGWRSEKYLLVVSFYGRDAQDRGALSRLANLASMTLAIMVKQYAPVDRASAVDIIISRLRRSFPSFSEREAQICAFSIIGWSSQKVARHLRITAGTVLTYRQRAYQKASIASAAELVPFILN